MLFEARKRFNRSPGWPVKRAGKSSVAFLLRSILLALIGLTLCLDGSAAAQRGASSSGVGREPGEFYAPYRGNPEDEPKALTRNSQPVEAVRSPEDLPPPSPDFFGDEGRAPDYNNFDGRPDLEPEEAPGPSGRSSERSEMLFRGNPDDPDYDKIPPADLPWPEEYPDLTVVPLPPPVQAPPLVPRTSPDQKDPAAAERDKISDDVPAGAVPALSIYPEKTRSALPKGAVPGLVTNARDVALIEKLRKNNDTAGKLNWEIGAEVSGTGLQGDGEGRLSGLDLENLDLVGLLDLSGAEGLLEFKSVGNPLTGLRMRGLPRLRSLTLNGGSLARLERGALSGLDELTSLDLGRNIIERIDANALAGLKSLEILRLNDNKLEQLKPGCFTGLGSLAELDLNNNQIYEVKWGVLSSLTGLGTLQLAGNRLTEIHSGFFPGLGNLEILHLENNRLTNVGREALLGLAALKYMDLSNNYLGSLPSLSHLENLSELDLTGNCLTLGAMRRILESVPENAAIHLKGQEQVYFGLRVQLLPSRDHYLIPSEDAFQDEIPSHGRILGPDPAGASYTPPEAAGQPGRLSFHRPGRYTLVLSNSGLGNTPDISAATGTFLVVDSYPTEEEAVRLLGRRDLATGLVRALSSRGFVEAPAANPKRISAMKALFQASDPKEVKASQPADEPE